MRISALLLALLLSVFAPVHAESRMDVGATIVNGDLRGFYFAIGEYFRVPEREVVVIRDRHLPHHEVPVALFIAQHAHVAPGMVIDLRLRGRSWMDITLHFGLGPEIYYVPLEREYGPPYGHAYGHYKKKNKRHWKKIRLNDDDVVNMVNLRFMSEHYHYAPDDVAHMRSSGKDFVIINKEIRGSRQDRMERRDDGGRGNDRMERRDDERGAPGHGKGKEKPGKNRKDD